jgi:hypothetical protein
MYRFTFNPQEGILYYATVNIDQTIVLKSTARKCWADDCSTVGNFTLWHNGQCSSVISLVYINTYVRLLVPRCSFGLLIVLCSLESWLVFWLVYILELNYIQGVERLDMASCVDGSACVCILTVSTLWGQLLQKSNTKHVNFVSIHFR